MIEISVPDPTTWSWWIWPLIVYLTTSVVAKFTGGTRSPLMVCNPDRGRLPAEMPLGLEILLAWIVAPLVFVFLFVFVAVWVVSLGVVPPPWRPESEIK